MTIKNVIRFFCLVGCTAFLSGCTTVTVYQSPVAQFQSSVNSANSGIRTYLLGVNDVIAKANLYDEVKAGNPWSPKDLNSGIPDKEIQLRLQALGTIATYANALGSMAESKDVANLQQAAITLGTNINNLSGTIQSIGQNANAKQSTKSLATSLTDPVTSLVTLFGTIAIEVAQKRALEKAIFDGSTDVDAIIDKLNASVPGFA